MSLSRRMLSRWGALGTFGVLASACSLGPPTLGWRADATRKLANVRVGVPAGFGVPGRLLDDVRWAAAEAARASSGRLVIETLPIPVDKLASPSESSGGLGRLLVEALRPTGNGSALAPEVDLLAIWDGLHVGPLVDGGVLAPLDTELARLHWSADAYPPAVLDAARRRGRLHALPVEAAPMMLYYDPELFTTAGVMPPAPVWTWDDVVRAGTALTRGPSSGGAGERWGIIAHTLMALWTHICQAGGDIVAADGRRIVLTEPAAVGGIEAWGDLIRRHGMHPPPTRPNGDPALWSIGPLKGIEYGEKRLPVGMLLQSFDTATVLLQPSPHIRAVAPPPGKVAATGAFVQTLLGALVPVREPAAPEALLLLAQHLGRRVLVPAAANAPAARSPQEGRGWVPSPALSHVTDEDRAPFLRAMKTVRAWRLDSSLTSILRSQLLWPLLRGDAPMADVMASAGRHLDQRIQDSGALY